MQIFGECIWKICVYEFGIDTPLFIFFVLIEALIFGIIVPELLM